MIVDTSALIAILRAEEDAPQFAAVLSSSDRTAISAGTLLECSVVIQRIGEPSLEIELEMLMKRTQIGVVAFDEAQANIARQAYRDYGKGSGHPARLNFGDCFAYALAKSRAEPLLFKGGDFRRTDVAPALPS